MLWSEKIISHKILIEKMLGQKSWGRVNPTGSLIPPPPPPKIVGLNCVVVRKNCWSQNYWLKKCLVKKSWGRVNPSGGGIPPPQKIVGLNCVGLFLLLLGEVTCKISYP